MVLPKCPVCGKETVFPNDKYFGRLVCPVPKCLFNSQLKKEEVK
jgi:hypothetical protein